MPLKTPFFEAMLHDLSNCHNQTDFLGCLAKIAAQLGFEYCAIGVRAAYPLVNPTISMISNYPPAWQARYAEQGYLQVDPVVLHGLCSSQPLVWSSSTATTTLSFWADADRHGVRHGWSQAHCQGNGALGLLTLARSTTPLEATEVSEKQCCLIWLAQWALQVFHRLVAALSPKAPKNPLGNREKQVLRWIADGKDLCEIAELMNISEATVRFHIRSALEKLGTPNKTAATVKALRQGWL